MFLFENTFMRIAISLIIVICASSIHEFAHAWAAHMLGDDTAKEQGRLTINPLAHIDPFGSIILPFFMASSGGPVFAYARPVPYNPNRLRNPGTDDAIVAIAGPISNLLQAVVGAIVYRLLRESGAMFSSEAGITLMLVLQLYIYINLILMFFNLLPIPPLDGSKLILPLLKGETKRQYYRVQQYALVVLMIVLYIVPTVLDFDPLSIYFNATAGRLFDLLMGG